MLRLKFFSCLFLCVVSCLFSASLPLKFVSVSSNYLLYDQLQSHFVVSENVSFLFQYREQFFNVRSQAARYTFATKQLQFLDGFSLKYPGLALNFSSFDYDGQTFRGRGKDLTFRLKRLQFFGDELDLSPAKVHVHHGRFSTCSGFHHYQVKTRHLYVYPKLNVVVALRNRLAIKYLPVDLPFPVLVMGLQEGGVLAMAPMAGRSVLEGNYIKQNIPYFIDYRLSGALQLGYAQHLGWMGHLSNDIRFSSRQSLNLQYLRYQKRRFAWGATHLFYFQGFRVLNPLDMLMLLSSEQKDFQQKLQTQYQERMIVNDAWVSYRPFVNLNTRFDSLYKFNLTFDGNIGYGSVSEENGPQDLETLKLDHRVGYVFDGPYVSKVTPFLNHSFFGYKGYASWGRLWGGLSIDFPTVLFKPSLQYSHMLNHHGVSMFAFENVYAVNEHELGLDLSHQFKHYELQLLSDYRLKSKNFRRLTISLERMFHCWKLGFVWDEVRDTIMLRFGVY
eukprot:COSAG05_NODE_236_length_13185_cov_2.137781_2_plen_502_part_00